MVPGVADARVWAVAAGGDYIPSFQRPGTAPIHYKWGILVIDSQSGSPIASFSGPGDWPTYFDKLPDEST